MIPHDGDEPIHEFRDSILALRHRHALCGQRLGQLLRCYYHLDVSRGPWKKNGALHSVIRVSYQAATSACSRTSLRTLVAVDALPWCTTPIEAESSLGPDSHHPIISLSGIPSAVMVLRILHPILASTLCAANPLARIAEPTIAL